MKISVAGIGYVGLSNAIILAQNNKVYVVDVVASKVDLINSKNFQSAIKSSLDTNPTSIREGLRRFVEWYEGSL